MRRSRLALMSVGAVLGISFIAAAALVWRPGPAQSRVHKSALAGCTRSTVIPVDWFCGQYVVHINPNGSRVRMKSTGSNFVPNWHPSSHIP